MKAMMKRWLNGRSFLLLASLLIAGGLLRWVPRAWSGQPPDTHFTGENAIVEEEKWEAPDQKAAASWAKEVVPFVETVVDECLLCRQQRLRDQELSVDEITNPYFLLDSPLIKKVEDDYGPVRFMHAKHAASAKDCAVCHHYRPHR